MTRKVERLVEAPRTLQLERIAMTVRVLFFAQSGPGRSYGLEMEAWHELRLTLKALDGDIPVDVLPLANELNVKWRSR